MKVLKEKSPPRGWALSIEERPATDPHAAALMQWAIPLEIDVGVACSATEIADHALLTAAHCVAGTDPPSAEINGVRRSLQALDHRACGHGPCATPFPVDQYEHFHEDIATLWVDDAVPMPSYPALGELRGDAPSAFMLSTRSGYARAVCRAFVTDHVGEVIGNVQPGDSGSSIVALRQDGSPIVLGVVSHRLTTGGEWYFAALPDVLPWPDAARDAAPAVEDLAQTAFATIQDCTP